MTIRRLFLLPTLLPGIIAMMLSSCNHKELCYEHPHRSTVRVEFDWTYAPDANPEGMCVYFYPLEGEDAPARRFDFSGRTGGEIDIQVGKYRVMCYNNDTEATQFRFTDDYFKHEAHTREGNIFEGIFGSGASYAPGAKGTEDQRVFISPDMVWSGVVEFDEVPMASNEAKPRAVRTDHVITLFPQEQICTYTYEILDVKNLKYASQMCATISGMSSSMNISTGDIHQEPVRVPFDAHSDGVSTITGRFLTFGHHELNTEPHKMVLYVWFVDGSTIYYTFDVTQQVHNAPDKRHVHIVIRGLDFPQPVSNGSGFKPSVDGWQEVREDIEM